MRKIYTKILTLSGEYITRVSFMSLPFLCNCLFLQGERSLFFQLFCTFKFFRIRSWKRNFSGQGATPHLELTVEAGSTRSGRTAPRELGGPRTGSTAPLSHSVAKRSSLLTPPLLALLQPFDGGEEPTRLDSQTLPQSKDGIISLTAEPECQGYVFSLFFLLIWMCETFYNQENVK